MLTALRLRDKRLDLFSRIECLVLLNTILILMYGVIGIYLLFFGLPTSHHHAIDCRSVIRNAAAAHPPLVYTINGLQIDTDETSPASFPGIFE